MSSKFHDEDVYPYETDVLVTRNRFGLTFPSSTFNVFRFTEYRLCGLFNTTLADS